MTTQIESKSETTRTPKSKYHTYESYEDLPLPEIPCCWCIKFKHKKATDLKWHIYDFHRKKLYQMHDYTLYKQALADVAHINPYYTIEYRLDLVAERCKILAGIIEQ
ncbi:MAG: hypothetical protein ACR2KF_08565 [Nitrososphaeraceae archaeon]